MEVNLVLLKNDGSYKAFELPSAVTIVGRRKCCDLQIPLRSVSRRHCQLNLDEDVLKVRDLGSRNGTLLNGQPVRKAELNAGDLLQIGPVAFVCQIDGNPSQLEKLAADYVRSVKEQAQMAEAEDSDIYDLPAEQHLKSPTSKEAANAETDDLDAILEEAELGDSGSIGEDFDPFEKD